MLSSNPFYHRLTRKYVTLFGNMFNDITLIKRNYTTGDEIERIKVPIQYAPKEKYFARLEGDPNLERETQITLPRLSFEITNFEYDASRQLNKFNQNVKGLSSTGVTAQYIGVPYDIGFQLNLYARNIDDGNQIIEQILPYFFPDYTISVKLIPELDFITDIPIILGGVSNTIEHEGNFDSVRYVSWNLTFTMKAYYYGPVREPKIIRKVITNIFNDPSIVSGYVLRVNTSGGNNGTYKIDDLVYQGSSYSNASAVGVVWAWSANTGKLGIGSTQGQFKVNTSIKAVSSNASFTLASFDASPIKLAKIVVEPDPIDADPTDDFGYTSTVTEFPETIE
jgi:hypothetical protein